MSTQIPDKIYYKGVQYDLYAKTGDNIFLFSPKEYGLIPQMRNTACIRGYWCEFDINDKLILKNMYVFAETYPEINGVNVNPIEYVDEEFYVIDKLEFVYHFIRNPRKRWCFQRFRNLGVGLFPCFFPYGEK